MIKRKNIAPLNFLQEKIYLQKKIIKIKNKKIKINLYCEFIIDGLKRFLIIKKNIEIQVKSGNYGKVIGNSCFNDNIKKIYFDSQIENPFYRKFNFVNVKIVSSFKKFEARGIDLTDGSSISVNSLIVSLYAESDRIEERWILI